MSALAKKMMEKYGWKEGEGLGKERSGVKSYVKVVRRDPNVATGLGHAADPAQGGNLASTHAVELDAIYGQLHKETKKKTKPAMKRARSSSDSDSERGADDASSLPSSDSDDDAEVKASGKVTEKSSRRQPSSSSEDSNGSSSSSDDDSDADSEAKGESTGDVTRMTDKDLFKRCGGVRLGRAGRHRFFDGKLKRIHGSH